VPVLAAGPPEIEGTLATIRLRPGILHQGRRPLLARHVVRSLMRLSGSPENSWLLGAFADVLVEEVEGPAGCGGDQQQGDGDLGDVGHGSLGVNGSR
jgi:hypothetical protein